MNFVSDLLYGVVIATKAKRGRDGVIEAAAAQGLEGIVVAVRLKVLKLPLIDAIQCLLLMIVEQGLGRRWGR